MEECRGRKVGIAQTIYEIDELIERLVRERMKALRKEDANEKERREANQRVLREGDGLAERISRAGGEGGRVRGEVYHGDTGREAEEGGRKGRGRKRRMLGEGKRGGRG